jgi:Carboxypeptidase regulatory-like domain
MWRFLMLASTMALAVGMLAQSAPSSDKRADPVAAPCTVAGRVVTAAEGSPLRSARIALVPEHSRSSQPQIFATISDSDGRFLLKDVAPGRYQFSAAHAGFVDQQYQSADPDSGVVLALKAGQKLDDVVFRMTVAAVVTGRITDDNDEPMTGVRITALPKLSEEEIEEEPLYGRSRKQDVTPVGAAETDDRGHYRLFGLRPGEYYIRANYQLEDRFGGFQWRDMQIRQSLGNNFAPLYYPGVLLREQAQIISLRAAEEAQADFSMRRIKTVEIAGRVIGPEGAAKNAWINLESTGMGEGAWDDQSSTNSDGQGNFRLKGVPPGSYTIVANTRAEGNKYYQGRQKVEVGSENIDSLVVSVGGGTSLRGRVTVAGPGSVALDQTYVVPIWPAVRPTCARVSRGFMA